MGRALIGDEKRNEYRGVKGMEEECSLTLRAKRAVKRRAGLFDLLRSRQGERKMRLVRAIGGR